MTSRRSLLASLGLGFFMPKTVVRANPPATVPTTISIASIRMTSLEVADQVAKIFPQGCFLTDANVAKIIEVGVKPFDLIRCHVPISGLFVDSDGSQTFYRDGKCHRDDGPAEIRANGYQAYYRDGKCHRDDGPAIIYPDGSQRYYRDGKCHRDDGPAVIYADGSRFHYREDKRHRDDGPAVIRADGRQEFWQHGHRVQP